MNPHALHTQLRGRRVLLLGGSGFVGSHLATFLVSCGVEVGVVTRSVREPISGEPGITLLPLLAGFDQTFDRFAPNVAVNLLVCYGRTGECLSEQIRANSLVPIQLAEYCDARGIRLVHIDTFSWKPRTSVMMNNSYARTKRLAGELLASFHLVRSSVAIARLEFPYGPGDRCHKLVPSLLRAFAAGQRVFDLSDATQSRDFIWIDDVTVALSTLLVADLPKGVTEVEIGTGTAVPLRDFVTELRDACGATTELRFGTRQRLPGEMESSCADTEWLARLGVIPKVSFREGCRLLAAATRARIRE